MQKWRLKVLYSIDMLFMAFPDAMPVSLDNVIPIIVSNSVANKVPTDGICMFDMVRTGDAIRPSPMAYQDSMREFLPSDFRNRLGRFTSADDLRLLYSFDDGLKVSILRAPQHGQIVDDKFVDKLPSYSPDKNFVGKDRVDVLVTGKDLQGRPIAKKLIYFINVIPEKDYPNSSAYYNLAVKKYCGVPKSPWRIGEYVGTDVEAAAFDLAAWKDTRGLAR